MKKIRWRRLFSGTGRAGGRKGPLRLTKRTYALAVFFCLVCAVFFVRLMTVQLFNRSGYAPTVSDGYISRETVIEAQRGSICDRDGKVLVTNEYTYNLNIYYYSLPVEVKEENAAFLAFAEVCERTGDEINYSEGYPLVGTYPNMSYAEGEKAASVRDAIIKRYRRKKDITAPELAKYLADRYELLDSEGQPLYSPEQMLTVMKIRWSLIEGGFYENGIFTLAEDVSRELIVAVRESNLGGGVIDTVSRRKYVYPGYASHILGQLGRIFAEDWEEYKKLGYSMDSLVGISGCEKVFEQYLRGRDGVLVTQYDANGSVVSQYVKEQPTAGKDVWLTIDIDLQIAAEDGLAENIEYVKARATGNLTGEDASAAAFTMVEVDTGQVLAMASYPTYNLLTFNEDYDTLAAAETSPLTNRAINGLYAPGSTFKVGMALAGLNEGVIGQHSLIHTTGRYTYFSSYQPRCWYYISTGRSHGSIDVSEALRVSCNCFFYEVGRKLSIEKMNNYCINFGLGQPTGFELGGLDGILAGPDYREANNLAAWQETDTIVAAIGQSENLFSPLQINMYMAAIANGGSRYSATLLHSVREFYTDEVSVSAAAPKVLSTFRESASDRALLLASLRSVVTTSSSLPSFFRGVNATVGGKTGTAQVGTTKSENALFAGVAPAEDPKVAAVCVIEQGHAGSYAAYTVGKVFREYFAED